MKTMKKVFALILAFVMAMAMTVTVFAEGETTPATTGTITVTNAQKDQTYSVYKIFDLTQSGDNVSYTATAAVKNWLATAAADIFAFDQAGDNLFYVSVKENVTDNQIIAFFRSLKDEDDGLSSALSSLKVGDSITATGDTVTFSNLPFGYYLVDSSLGAIVSVDSTMPNAEVHDKNWDTTITKKIVVGDDRVDVNEAELGETVTFEVKIPTHHYIDQKVDCYYVFDNMCDALTPVLGSDGKPAVTVKNGNEDVAFTVTTEGITDANFRINIPTLDDNGDFLFENNDELTITYQAIVTENVNDHIGEGKAPNMRNTAYIDYTTIPDDDTPPTPPTPPTHPDEDKPNDSTDHYSVEIKVLKTDGTNTLTGAKFTLTGYGSKIAMINKEIYVPYKAAAEGATQPTAYWMLKDGKYTSTDPATETLDEEYLKNYDNPSEKFMKITTVDQTTLPAQQVTATGYVDENGVMTFIGLGAGTYQITELIAPDGYNRLQSPINVVVSFTGTTTTNAAFTAKIDGEATTVDNGVITVTVVNNAGTELPSTGGMGTTMFMVIGAILLVGAAILLVSKKRMYNAR